MHYFVSGLHLLTNQPLAGLMPQAAPSQVDVRISMGRTLPGGGRQKSKQVRWYASSDLDERGEPLFAISTVAEGGYYLMAYHDGAEFLFDRGGTRVWGVWSESVSIDDRSVCLLGPVLSFVLCLRGITCLHASAISIAGRAIAFVGPEGAGKSTTAAAFALGGYGILADDVVALRPSTAAVLIQPSYPWLRLRPSAVEALFDTAVDVPRLLPRVNGLYFDLDLGRDGYKFEQRALPLAAIYFLIESADDIVAPKVEAMTGREGLITLIASTWATRVLDPSMRAREFETLRRLCANVPLRCVRSSRTRLPPELLCGPILKDVQQFGFDSGEIRPRASASLPTLSVTA
jgi:hypothetical protein